MESQATLSSELLSQPNILWKWSCLGESCQRCCGTIRKCSIAMAKSMRSLILNYVSASNLDLFFDFFYVPGWSTQKKHFIHWWWRPRGTIQSLECWGKMNWVLYLFLNLQWEFLSNVVCFQSLASKTSGGNQSLRNKLLRFGNVIYECIGRKHWSLK